MSLARALLIVTVHWSPATVAGWSRRQLAGRTRITEPPSCISQFVWRCRFAESCSTPCMQDSVDEWIARGQRHSAIADSWRGVLNLSPIRTCTVHHAAWNWRRFWRLSDSQTRSGVVQLFGFINSSSNDDYE